MKTKILASLLTIVSMLVIVSMAWIPTVSAEKNTVYLDPGEGIFYDLIELEKDSKVTYIWNIYQPGDDYVRFWIEGSDGTDYVESYGDISGSGTWTVPKDGHYKIFWKNENFIGTVQIDYEVTLKKPKEIPGFEFVETFAVIGLVALIYTIKKGSKDI